MIQTKSNSSVLSIKCQHLRRLFQHYSIDIFILQIYYTLTSLTIVISNGLLLHKLFKKKHKKRADKMFIILSFSDIGVGLINVPIMALVLFIKDFRSLCQLSPILKFFTYVPYGFSWFMIILIALDRVLVITKGYIYKKYVTIKHLYCLAIFCLLSVIIMSLIFSLKTEFMGRNPFVVGCIGISLESCWIIITSVAYMYLFYFVRSRSRVIANTRHSGNKFDKKLMMTITYTYICLLLFTLPYFTKIVVTSFFPVIDPEIERNIQCWGTILAFSNSYANAFIILLNSRGKQKDVQHTVCSTQVSRKTITQKLNCWE